jgi:hypothetical protein
MPKADGAESGAGLLTGPSLGLVYIEVHIADHDMVARKEGGIMKELLGEVPLSMPKIDRMNHDVPKRLNAKRDSNMPSMIWMCRVIMGVRSKCGQMSLPC